MSRWESTDPATGAVVYLVPDNERRRIVLADAGCPGRHLLAAGIDLVDEARKWMSNPVREWAITFLGGAGAGKTWQATRLLAELAARGDGSCWWISSLDLILRTKEELYLDNGASIDRARGCDVLLLDDLGSERSTDWAIDLVNVVLSHRYNHELTTIVTSNLPLEKIGTFDPRLISRLSGHGRIVYMTEEDRRGR